MAEQIEQDIHESTIYDDLITSLITLKVVLEDIDIDLEKNDKIRQLKAELLEKELSIITLRPNKIECNSI